MPTLKRLVLLASPTLRRGPLSALQRFVCDHEQFLERFEIVTTEGCRRALLRAGLLHKHPRLKANLPGYLGGVVHLASLIVDAKVPVEAVIYLIDPKDSSSIFPETNAFKRECVVHKVRFFSTSRAAREWAAIRWTGSPKHFATPDDIKGLTLVKPLEDETIALIAHDGMKKELLQFACKHFNLLLRFGQRVATGTTGNLLNGGPPDPGRLEPEECRELAPLCRKLQSLIAGARAERILKPKAPFVVEKPSGPKGGDVMIARLVLENRCQRIVFFENPLKPHEHTEDIQLLERTGRLRGKTTTCIHDQRTAAWFAGRWEAAEKRIAKPRLLLSSVIERLFGTKCVLVPTEPSQQQTWSSIRSASAWFLLSHLAMLAAQRKAAGERVRVAVTWGLGSSEIVAQMEHELAVLRRMGAALPPSARVRSAELEDGALNLVGGADHMLLMRALADDQLFRPGHVTVAPTQGLVGSEDAEVEANAIASRLAVFLRGDPIPLPANALAKRRRGMDPAARHPTLIEHWGRTDLVLTTAAAFKDRPPNRPETPTFEAYLEEMERAGACGDLGGMYLNERGEPVESAHLERVGMSPAQMRAVRTRRGMIVATGAQPARMRITLAALMGGWVSVLVTDIRFARMLVRELSRKVRKGTVRLSSLESIQPLVRSAHFGARQAIV